MKRLLESVNKVKVDINSSLTILTALVKHSKLLYQSDRTLQFSLASRELYIAVFVTEISTKWVIRSDLPQLQSTLSSVILNTQNLSTAVQYLVSGKQYSQSTFRYATPAGVDSFIHAGSPLADS